MTRTYLSIFSLSPQDREPPFLTSFSKSPPGHILFLYQRLSKMPHPPQNFSCSSPCEYSEHIVFLFWHSAYYALCYDTIFTFNWAITSHCRHSIIWCVNRTPSQKINSQEVTLSAWEEIQSTRMQLFWEGILVFRSKTNGWAVWKRMAEPQKIKEFPYDPATPLLGISPKGGKAGLQPDSCTPRFTAASFTRAKR